MNLQHNKCAASAWGSEEISHGCRPECDLGKEQACNECHRQREQHLLYLSFLAEAALLHWAGLATLCPSWGQHQIGVAV